jgi:hypothetical protein
MLNEIIDHVVNNWKDLKDLNQIEIRERLNKIVAFHFEAMVKANTPAPVPAQVIPETVSITPEPAPVPKVFYAEGFHEKDVNGEPIAPDSLNAPAATSASDAVTSAENAAVPTNSEEVS